MNKIQLFSRIIYKSSIITLLILNLDNNAFYSIWIGLIISFFSEIDNINKI